jgi:hypothetical protein
MKPILTTPASESNLLDHAIDYARRGWSVIPVIGKKPRGLWKPFQQRRPDEATLHKQFSRPGITGLAVISGAVSGGLAIRDFDQADAYRTWADAHPEDASLPTARTRRGFHVFGRLDTERYATLPDGELRGDSGHYTLLPPSAHPDGGQYAWVVPLSGDLPPLPSSLLSELKHNTSNTQDNARQHIACVNTLEGRKFDAVLAATLPTRPGQRNRKLFDLARALKGLIPAATPHDLRELVYRWHEMAQPFTSGEHTASDSYADFIIAWQRVKRPVGASFKVAVVAAESHEPSAAQHYDGHLRRLVCLCFQLQRQWHGPFPLSCRTAAKYLEISHVAAWRLLNALQFDLVLELVTKGAKGKDGEEDRGSTWRFHDRQPSDGPYRERY